MSVIMDESLKLRIASIFILFCASMGGLLLPLYYARNADRTDEASHQKMADCDNFRILRSFAAGIMLGVAFIHLLYESTATLAEISLDYPSLGFTLATVGTLIVLGFEQVAVMLISRIEVGYKQSMHQVMTSKDSGKHDHESPHSELEVVETTKDTHQSSCDHTHAINMIAGSDSFSILIKAYMMEISVAIHSFIIGIALGSLAGQEHLQSLHALLIAFCFHQFFEGLGLGTVIEAARMHLGDRKIIVFAMTFALTVPIGIVIGIVITDNNAVVNGPSVSQEYALGCLNSIAAGLMIYVALVGMIADDFQQASIAFNINLKIKMFSALCTGTFIMAILAIWA